MDIYLKAVAAVFITAIICIVLVKYGKEFSVVLSVAACCLILAAAFTFIKPVVALINQLSELGKLNNPMLQILLKSVRIAMLAEITELVCKDAGNNTLGKALQILSTSVILWLSIPLFNELISLIQSVMNYT